MRVLAMEPEKKFKRLIGKRAGIWLSGHGDLASRNALRQSRIDPGYFDVRESEL